MNAATTVGTVTMVLLLSACTVVGPIHRGEVLERAEGDPDSDNWVVLVELENQEILGTDVVYVGVTESELMCEDGTPLAPDELQPGETIRFLRDGDGVDTSSPPAIRGKRLHAECD